MAAEPLVEEVDHRPHERVRHTPRVRAVIDFLYERLSRHVRDLRAKRAAA